MDCEIADKTVRLIYTDLTARSPYPEGVTKRLRFVLGLIVNAIDERDFRGFPGLRYEKLKGQRAHQHSFRLNDQYRLIIEVRGDAATKTIVVVGVEDYH